MDKVNTGVSELLEKYAKVDPDPAPEAFAFSDFKDQDGVPVEHSSYIKRSCKRCYGRGYETYLVGNGYYTKEGEKTKRRARNHTRCACVASGYIRARNEVLRLTPKLVEKGLTVDVARAHALKKVLGE